mmetsp:Transcript_34310/g.66418  ORF Transcript_34310/g.66418 Transcript_34310/m.66418 type:complete len:212 (-) Transcript_34310:134-769(-)
MDARQLEGSIVNKIQTDKATLLAKCTDSTQKRNQVIRVIVEFSGDRIKGWKCSCDPGRRSRENSGRIPRGCLHIACSLLALAKQQKQDPLGQTQLTDIHEKTLYVPPHRRMNTRAKIKEAKLFEQFDQLTVDHLRSMLQRNGQSSSGLKRDLIEQCVDGAMRGALPRCPQCLRGHLVYRLYEYRCNGYYDAGRVQDCGFSAPEVERTAWRQ